MSLKTTQYAPFVLPLVEEVQAGYKLSGLNHFKGFGHLKSWLYSYTFHVLWPIGPDCVFGIFKTKSHQNRWTETKAYPPHRHVPGFVQLSQKILNHLSKLRQMNPTLTPQLHNAKHTRLSIRFASGDSIKHFKAVCVLKQLKELKQKVVIFYTLCVNTTVSSSAKCYIFLSP